jgi:DNA repair exonuclease SbcCD ATPase subunit
MNVQRLVLNNFTVHEHSEFVFPERGIVLVTGPNGGGKSSVIEGVAYGGFGETLRGTSPWVKEKAGMLRLLAEGLGVTRTRTAGGRSALDWSTNDGPSAEYETNSKAQEALEERIGSFETWRWRHVFSSSDAARFTEATDSERKRFLEGLLQLGRFDVALEKCRTDLKAATRQWDECRRQAAILDERVKGAARSVLQCTETVTGASVPPLSFGDEETESPLALQTQATEVKKAIDKTEASRRAEYSKAMNLRSSDGGVQANMDALKRQLQKLGDTGTCSACGQEIPAKLRGNLVQAIGKLKKEAEATQAKSVEAVLEIDEQLKELDGILAALNERHAKLRERIRSAEAGVAAHARRKGELDRAYRALAQAEADLKKTKQQFADADTEAGTLEKTLQELGAVEVVLGTKGVRAHILGRALGAVEAAANGWLARISGAPRVTAAGPVPALSVRLKSYTEKKTGGVTDAISLEVEGAGGGEGYRGASAGERRRIDVALLFALGALSGGLGAGTLFFDEVFDSLYVDGQDALAAVLVDLAKERAVVVITHSDYIAGRLQLGPTVKWRIEGGQLQGAA